MGPFVLWAKKYNESEWGILNIVDKDDGGLVKAQKYLHGWAAILQDHQFRIVQMENASKCQPVNNRGFVDKVVEHVPMAA